jgi:ferredoxin--NADP+ reductase
VMVEPRQEPSKESGRYSTIGLAIAATLPVFCLLGHNLRLYNASMPARTVDQPDGFSPVELERLRVEHYNAMVVTQQEVHSDLRILRIVPDVGVPTFRAGQYMGLGLGNWERRVAEVDAEVLDELHRSRLSKRAYSVSCSILDDAGRVRRPDEFAYLEFYVALVRHAARRPPALTPRLFALKPGSRLFVESHAAGHYTLAPVKPDDDVFFFATGTGEAPHNAMIAELLTTGHRGRIVSAICVRRKIDAAYHTVHEDLVRRFTNYRYLVLTTREPENVDPAHPQYVGKQYFQDFVQSGRLESETQVLLNPQRVHVFLCGNPEMIGLNHHGESPLTPAPGSMLEVLVRRGFVPDQPHYPGNLHFERYW